MIEKPINHSRVCSNSPTKSAAELISMGTRTSNAPTALITASLGGTNHGAESRPKNQYETAQTSQTVSTPPVGTKLPVAHQNTKKAIAELARSTKLRSFRDA
eukprot:CAMPEP_0184458140 /NCGR_PEP_ID=MMETSP0740-20130409/32297_1 /TAXON_ID=385413 /ORGANISM="Thalassiosira miniscula, Strain CCMP1093" /LENGTH=101 /DNA_ID=CAMNT_0026830709 /DNA_START=16 /DNA_END=321 /DNA_ORIENTATION=+